jgi:hypothetical protein
MCAKENGQEEGSDLIVTNHMIIALRNIPSERNQQPWPEK